MYNDEKAIFKQRHGYDLNIDNPRSFNEKIIRKKLFCRNQLLPITADKYRARQYIRMELGYYAEAHFVPLLWVGKHAAEIPFNRLPDNYIIKPNNGAGRWLIRNNGKFNVNKHDVAPLSESDQVAVCREWFETVHGASAYEWAYSEIYPLIVVEALLRTKSGGIPWDYRFCMFHGVCRMVYVTNYQGGHQYFSYYDADWKQLPIQRDEAGKIVDKPEELGNMLHVAERLSKPFDFVRIDFFVVDDWFYMSEITHYPGSGYTKITPTEYDFELGKYW